MFDWLGRKRKSTGAGPDYTQIDSREKALRLVQAGELVALYLLPPEFGGDNAAPNTVYVPAFAVEIKEGIDANTVMPLVREGKVTRYAATPQYQGRSFVPNAIVIRATEPADLEATVRIWGEALQAEVPRGV